MQIETFKVFCDLVDTSSFSLAAERNGITQSAVSQQIRSLEVRYGVRFFERGKKNFSITPEGQVFDEAAREIVAMYSRIGDELKALRDEVIGVLRVATVYSIGMHELPPLAQAFREAFPDVDLQIEYLPSNQVYLDVIEGRADLGLVAYPRLRKGVVVEEFSEDRLVVVCAARHELSSRKRIRLSDLDGVRFVSFGSDLPTRKAVDKLLREAGVQVKHTYEFDNVETVKRAVEVEKAVSILPEATVAREVAGGTLCAIDVVGSADMRRPLGIVKKRTRAVSPAMREFLKMLGRGGT